MNRRTINLIKNFLYTISSNLISMIISVLVTLIVPKLIGIEEYGFWQLYLFYSSYVGFLHFGWNDGIYLRYGGQKYRELDKKVFFSQFYMLTILQILLAVIIIVISKLLNLDVNRVFIFEMVALCMIIVNVRCMLIYILQGTNRIKEYSQIIMMDRVLYCCLIIIFLVFGIREYRLMIVADLIGKLISLLYTMYCCKDIVFGKLSIFYFSFRETINNMNVGIKLMIANIASMLIIGVVRFGIENSWSIATFGKVSLTLSISNIIMLFINSIGIIIFPILRRTDENSLPSFYLTMRDFLLVMMLGILIVYYPLRVALTFWLPKYAESLMYISMILPICIFEGKMALLINTFLKTLRKEKLMLKINLISLGLSVVFTIINTLVFKNLSLTVFSILILLAFRCVFAEICLSIILKISLYKDMILELIMICIFVLTGWFINSWFTVWIYTVAYTLYLFIKRKDICKTIETVMLLIKV